MFKDSVFPFLRKTHLAYAHIFLSCVFWSMDSIFFPADLGKVLMCWVYNYE